RRAGPQDRLRCGEAGSSRHAVASPLRELTIHSMRGKPMTHRPRTDRILVRWRRAGFAATALAVAGVGLMASAAPAATRHLTLKAEHVSSLSATVLAAPNGRTLYRLKPETTHHLLCTSSTCLSFWHPLTVSSKSTKLRLPSGLSGHAHLFKRGHRF